jgi:DNA mismatch repair ATPase MutS
MINAISESFGVECARLAALPESILITALDKSRQMSKIMDNRAKLHM